MPLTSSYVSDEIPGVLGSLHMAAAQSLFGLRDQPTVYYGPVYSVFTLPAVAVDYGVRLLEGQVRSPNDYRLAALFNWGPLLFDARVTSVLAGFVGLWLMWLLLGTASVNPGKRRSLQVLGVVLLATNFFYFVYAGWARHWIYDTVLCLAPIYFAVKLYEKAERKWWCWMLAVAVMGFGVSYFPIVFQVALVPAIVGWIRRKDWVALKNLAWYVLALVVLGGFVVFWNPLPFSWIFVSSQGTQYLIGSSRLASFGYFLSVIATDHPFLSAAFLISLVALALKRQFWRAENAIVLLPAAVYFVAFALSWHPEPRYMMPVIVSMLVFSLMALSRLWPDVRPRDWSAVIIVGLVLEIAFQSATLVQWERIVARGPVEERVIAALNGLDQFQHVLVYDSGILPTLHDPASLRAYVKNCLGGVSSATLRELSGAITTGTPLLKADYYCDGQTGTALTPEEYDVRVQRLPGNPVAVNFFEEDIWRLWRYDAFGLKYSISSRGGAVTTLQ